MREEKKKSYRMSKGLLGALIFLCCMAMSWTVSADPKAYDLLVPLYDTAYLSDAEIDEMPLQVLCYAKNEIYAQHGRKFVSKELTEYFNEQPWYYGRIEGTDFSESVFNDYEKKNIQALTAREKELKEGGYQLDQAGYSFQPIYDYVNQRYGLPSSGSSLPSIASGFDYDDKTREVSTDFFSFTVPDEWELIWTYDEGSADSVSFCCGPVKANSEMDGALCTILRMDTYEADGYFPDADYLGESGGYYYYLLYPTDVRFDMEHMDVYNAMAKGTEKIPASFRLR